MVLALQLHTSQELAALIKSINPSATPTEIEVTLHNEATKAPPTGSPGSPLQPCDGNGRGYFEHKYTPPTIVFPTTGGFQEPLLYMGNIK